MDQSSVSVGPCLYSSVLVHTLSILVHTPEHVSVLRNNVTDEFWSSQYRKKYIWWLGHGKFENIEFEIWDLKSDGLRWFWSRNLGIFGSEFGHCRNLSQLVASCRKLSQVVASPGTLWELVSTCLHPPNIVKISPVARKWKNSSDIDFSRNIDLVIWGAGIGGFRAKFW